MHRRRRTWLTKMTSITKHARSSVATKIRPVILDASGLALITVSAFRFDQTSLGFAVAGLACFALQWRLRG